MSDLERAVAQVRFPSDQHRCLVLGLARVYGEDPVVRAILLGGSLSRERGHPSSDVDLVVVVPAEHLGDFLVRERDREPAYRALGATLIETEPDGATLDFGGMAAHVWSTDGVLRPQAGEMLRDDSFELAIAAFVYGRPLLERDDYLQTSRARYLPFYSEDLRRDRLCRLRDEFAFNLRQVEFMAERGLYFHGLERLIVAFRLFVKFLFLTRRRYPIDYLKHVEEQVGEWLGRPDLLPVMRDVLALPQLDGPTLRAKAAMLRSLLDQESHGQDFSLRVSLQNAVRWPTNERADVRSGC
jgi:predicted nucleotidyltransferase